MEKLLVKNTDFTLNKHNKNIRNKFSLIFFIPALAIFYVFILSVNSSLTGFNLYRTLDDDSQVKDFFILFTLSGVVLVLLSLFFFFAFFKRKASTVKLFLSIVVLYPIIHLMMFLYGYYMAEIDVFILGYMDNLLIETIILLGLLCYLLLSKTVKKTFTL